MLNALEQTVLEIVCLEYLQVHLLNAQSLQSEGYVIVPTHLVRDYIETAESRLAATYKEQQSFSIEAILAELASWSIFYGEGGIFTLCQCKRLYRMGKRLIEEYGFLFEVPRSKIVA